MRYLAPLTCLLLMLSASITSADDPIEGIGPVGETKTIGSDFMFTEGPAADAQGNVYFTDIPAQKIYKLDTAGELSVFSETSNHSNGLMFTGNGKLLACEMDGAVVERDVESGKRRVLTDKYDGKRYNANNDLVIAKNGGIYFTDPRFRAPEPWPQGKEAVYYRSPKGEVTRIIDGLSAPNGVILSPDEKTLYVIPSMSKDMMSYPVNADGSLGEGKVFCTLKQPEGRDNTGGDGLTVDTKGNVYITSGIGVQVYDPAGKYLGNIAFPQQPANVTFGGKDNKTLVATARTGVYTVAMQAEGHRFTGSLPQSDD